MNIEISDYMRENLIRFYESEELRLSNKIIGLKSIIDRLDVKLQSFSKKEENIELNVKLADEKTISNETIVIKKDEEVKNTLKQILQKSKKAKIKEPVLVKEKQINTKRYG